MQVNKKRVPMDAELKEAIEIDVNNVLFSVFSRTNATYYWRVFQGMMLTNVTEEEVSKWLRSVTKGVN